MAYGDLEYLKYYYTHLREIQKIEEKLSELPEADWIRKARDPYTGFVHYFTLRKIIGDIKISVVMGDFEDAKRHFLKGN